MKILLALLGLLASASLSAQAAPSAPAYLFFDWGKSELTTDATAILDGVVAQYRAAPSALLIDGHSDRSGAAAGNLVSSRKRAEIARDYLAAHGIPAGAMRVRAYGEAAPIIATEDGVREVQNRRVEIRFVAAQ